MFKIFVTRNKSKLTTFRQSELRIKRFIQSQKKNGSFVFCLTVYADGIAQTRQCGTYDNVILDSGVQSRQFFLFACSWFRLFALTASTRRRLQQREHVERDDGQDDTSNDQCHQNARDLGPFSLDCFIRQRLGVLIYTPQTRALYKVGQKSGATDS